MAPYWLSQKSHTPSQISRKEGKYFNHVFERHVFSDLHLSRMRRKYNFLSLPFLINYVQYHSRFSRKVLSNLKKYSSRVPWVFQLGRSWVQKFFTTFAIIWKILLLLGLRRQWWKSTLKISEHSKEKCILFVFVLIYGEHGVKLSFSVYFSIDSLSYSNFMRLLTDASILEKLYGFWFKRFCVWIGVYDWCKFLFLQVIWDKVFKFSSTNVTWSILEYFVSYNTWYMQVFLNCAGNI